MISGFEFIRTDSLGLPNFFQDKVKKRKRKDDIPSDTLMQALPTDSHKVKRSKITIAKVLKRGSSPVAKQPIKKKKAVIAKKYGMNDLSAPLLEKIVSFLSPKERIITRRVNKAFSSVAGTPNDEEVLTRFIKLRQDKPIGWELKAVKLIRQNRHEILHYELARLKLMGFSKKSNTLLQKAVKKIGYGSGENDLRAKVLFAQAFAIREIYGEDYDVFIHAQKTRLTCIPHLIKELIKTFDPTRDIRNFKFLRLPESYRKDSEKSLRTVREFLKSRVAVHDHETQAQELLLSVDAYYCNTGECESALDFLLRNQSIDCSYHRIESLARKIIRCFCSKITVKDEKRLLEKLSEASQVYEKSLAGGCGNLFVLCIPKEKSYQMQYRAHPFGVPCNCHPNLRARKILNRLKRDNFGEDIQCKDGLNVPQYRLYTPLLIPEMGVRSYLLTLAAKKDRTILKNAIKQVAKEVHEIQKK